MKKVIIIFLVILAIYATFATSFARQSFYRAKKILTSQVYALEEDRITLYCQAHFDTHGNIILPDGFTTGKYLERASRLEWEHVVPVEHFGKAFPEWREGHPLCVDKDGKAYKGRGCAEKTNTEFRRMQADMHNIYPTIGSVNATRSNYDFTFLPDAKNDLGMCPMKVDRQKVEPPPSARGKIARAYLYMESIYPKHYTMNAEQRNRMRLWDNLYPVTEDECRRAQYISEIQGNENLFIQNQCIEVGLQLKTIK